MLLTAKKFKIGTNLCNMCVRRDMTCDNVDYLYGDKVGDMPNICACSGFDAIFVRRQDKAKPELKGASNIENKETKYKLEGHNSLRKKIY